MDRIERDDNLIRRYLGGETDAFETLYRRHARRLVGFLVSLSGDPATADELAQEVWIRVIDRFEAYEPRGRFRAWLFQVAVHRWRDYCRRLNGKRSRGVLSGIDPEELICPEGPPDVVIQRREETRRIEAALAALPEGLREIVLLRADGELTFREIAAATDTPLGTVLWRMRTARRRLRGILAEGEASGRKGVKTE